MILCAGRQYSYATLTTLLVYSCYSFELTSRDHEMKPSYCRPETNGLVLVMIVLWIVRLQHKTVLITLLKHAVIQPSKALICSSTERHPRYLNG